MGWLEVSRHFLGDHAPSAGLDDNGALRPVLSHTLNEPLLGVAVLAAGNELQFAGLGSSKLAHACAVDSLVGMGRDRSRSLRVASVWLCRRSELGRPLQAMLRARPLRPSTRQLLATVEKMIQATRDVKRVFAEGADDTPGAGLALPRVSGREALADRTSVRPSRQSAAPSCGDAGYPEGASRLELSVGSLVTQNIGRCNGVAGAH